MLELNAMLTLIQIRLYKDAVYDAHNKAFVDYHLTYEQKFISL